MFKYIKVKKPIKTDSSVVEKVTDFCKENIYGNRRHIKTTDGLDFFWCEICGTILTGMYTDQGNTEIKAVESR